MARLKDSTINDTGFLQIPTGTTGQRPGSPQPGQIRFNTTLNIVEWYDDEYNLWYPTGVVPPIATGGTVTNVTVEGINYRVHTFTSVGRNTFTVTRSGQVEYLVVAGGGAGGPGSCNAGSNSGGGAGGLLTGLTTVEAGEYFVTVGTGGAGPSQGNPPVNGGNSSALGVTAIGGGGGGVADSGCTGGSSIANAASGGSGGGAQSYTGSFYTGGKGTPGQGNAGGDGKNYSVLSSNYISGSGGGAGGPGITPQDSIGSTTACCDGGPGVSSTISGTLTFYAGGGSSSNYRTTNGTAGIGNDIGGGGNQAGSGKNGIVIIRYRTS